MTSLERQPELADVRLVGELVELRLVRPADAEQAFPLIRAREEILQWLVWNGPADAAELAEVYENARVIADTGANYQLAILERGSCRFSGAISLRFLDHPFVGDVGYWVAQDAWGRGMGTEANFLVAHLAFRHLRTSVMTAEVFLGNAASVRVLEKVGYERERSIETKPLPRGSEEIDRPKDLFSLTRRSFEAIHADRTPVEEWVLLT